MIHRFPCLLVLALLVMGAAVASPTDPLYYEQWGLKRVGAEFAWEVSTGGAVIIAVVDTGVDLAHPDLKGKLIEGRDFVDPGTDARDEHGHGTLVAGAAAARSNNVAGIASVAPAASILPIRVFDAGGEATAEDAAAAIDYAVERAESASRPLVLNLSFDWSSEASEPLKVNLFESEEVDNAVRRAADAGAAVIVASGNNGRSETAYDATAPGIAVVGSSGRSDARATFSNYGSGLDLVAPGVEIISTYFDPNDSGSKYAYASGTSMSVPLVAGAAALLMSEGMSNAEAVARIARTADDSGSRGWDSATGHGVLDVAAALGASRSIPAPSPPKPPGPAEPRKARLIPAPARVAASPDSLRLPSPRPPLALPVEDPPAPIAETETSKGDSPADSAAAAALALVAVTGAGQVLYRRFRVRI